MGNYWIPVIISSAFKNTCYLQYSFNTVEQHKKPQHRSDLLIGIVGGGGAVQLGPLGTAATHRPTVPALGDYYDGEKLVEW
jgi:hypothetical protein